MSRKKKCHSWKSTESVSLVLEMSSVSMISHEVSLLPQCFSANDVIIKKVYKLRK